MQSSDPYVEIYDADRGHGQHFSVPRFVRDHGVLLEPLPYVARILIENALRHESASHRQRPKALALLRTYHPDLAAPDEAADIWLYPTRVLAQDVSGIPALIDLAAMRDALRQRGGDPRRINPVIPTDLIVDHSLIAEEGGHAGARAANEAREHLQNQERYTFLKWAQGAFDNLRLVPPGKGILHQINLEYLAAVATTVCGGNGEWYTCPDTLVGTDSHTTMVNALGVLGWGVGGIEAEAAMLGDALVQRAPQIVGVRLINQPHPGINATDLVLNLTRILREAKVVAQFVEFSGPALDGALSLEDRATLSNMAPEYGSTCAYFPIDEETLSYMARTGRGADHIEHVRRYAKAAGLWRGPVQPTYRKTIEVDLASLGRVAAGPSRPQDRMGLSEVPISFARATLPLPASHAESLPEGAVVLAAITSCTNTSNPRLLVAAGLLARKARAQGLRAAAWTKTSFTPGSRVVADYLQASGLQTALDELGFQVAGYGCATCAGLSGPLSADTQAGIEAGSRRVAAVLSGNRNFPGRVHPQARANYLVSPPLVVAYALAGTVTHDLERDVLAWRADGQPVRLADLWPSDAEIDAVVEAFVRPEMFVARYRDVFDGDASWQALPDGSGACYPWEADSLYLRRPPYLDVPTQLGRVHVENARALLILGDAVTTDHISPANEIPPDSSAGRYLLSLGVSADQLHTYLARRGNHRVMMRATFAQPTLVNELLPQGPPGATREQPGGQILPIYDVAMRYREAGTPVIVVAGKDYGNGSSRDWAAKGTRLLGVRAVLAESFERIHRSNLVNMGILPLELPPGETRTTLGLDGTEYFDFDIPADLTPQGMVPCRIRGSAAPRSVLLRCRLDNEHEIDIWRAGGILPSVLRQALQDASETLQT
ncbi:aconitate hydratase AcnA [Bordetella genomosp. 12]|uniref:Aconitate hydratase n=1 Tax=Bordetella genomosp. 12 TaxID=463035 RepID=A0A261VMW7_9BORD|nr:aconitate hydratase AcnA [Bordetella genomosp. 12]OZI74832.1 aconitate hydratase 1 [Bordetella genomosp. 12]